MTNPKTPKANPLAPGVMHPSSPQVSTETSKWRREMISLIPSQRRKAISPRIRPPIPIPGRLSMTLLQHQILNPNSLHLLLQPQHTHLQTNGPSSNHPHKPHHQPYLQISGPRCLRHHRTMLQMHHPLNLGRAHTTQHPHRPFLPIRTQVSPNTPLADTKPTPFLSPQLLQLLPLDLLFHPITSQRPS